MTPPKAGFCMGQAQLVNYIINEVGVPLFVLLHNIKVIESAVHTYQLTKGGSSTACQLYNKQGLCTVVCSFM
jgi:hypothetical protein